MIRKTTIFGICFLDVNLKLSLSLMSLISYPQYSEIIYTSFSHNYNWPCILNWRKMRFLSYSVEYKLEIFPSIWGKRWYHHIDIYFLIMPRVWRFSSNTSLRLQLRKSAYFSAILNYFLILNKIVFYICGWFFIFIGLQNNMGEVNGQY